MPTRWRSARRWSGCSASRWPTCDRRRYEGKWKRVGRFEGQRSDWKKAVGDARARPQDRAGRGGLRPMWNPDAKPTSAARGISPSSPTRRSRRRRPRRACSRPSADQWTERVRPYHRAAPGRRAKRMLRDVDFRRDKVGSRQGGGIEYDPAALRGSRSCTTRDGEKRYIIARWAQAGDMVMSGPQADILPGNALPTGTSRSVRSCTTWSSARARRSALSSAGMAPALAKEGDHADLKLPSRRAAGGSTAWPPWARWATSITRTCPWASAGRVRWKGFRPTVRGTVMNPVDHPMGGGEGKARATIPMTPWGKLYQGLPDPRGARRSDRFIVTPDEVGEDDGTLAQEGPFVEMRLMTRIDELNPPARRRC